MKQSTLVYVSIAILLVGGVSVYALNRSTGMQTADTVEKSKEVMESDADSMMAEDTMLKDDEVFMQDGGAADEVPSSRYQEFSDLAMDSSADTRRVLFFYANWCPTCQPADVDFRNNVSQIPEDVTVIRVNYNDTETDAGEEALAEKYGVTYQHTYVQIDSEGNEVAKWNGGQLEQLLTNIQ